MTATASTRARQRQHDAEQRRALAAQTQQRRHARRIVFASVSSVLAVVATIVIVGVATSGAGSSPAAPPNAVPAGVLANITGVPQATLDAIGSGTATNPPQAVSDGVLTANGKPEVLYLGAEYCPFCALQRWPLIQALSRFGTFTGLSTSRSSSVDVHPNTPTFTFHGATYTSKYLTFTARELFTNVRKGNSYTPLDKATPAEEALLQKYGGSFPLLDIGGRSVQVGASYKPELLHGLEWEQISAALADPTSPLARGIDGSANVLTAALCTLTGNQPSKVCSAPAVRAASNG